MNFIAFDFETANSRADSACQLALVSVRDGEIEAEYSWLIRPPKMYFSRRNIAIHGIRPEQVVAAATMEKLWPELSQLIDGRLLVAHNAGFDVGVLVNSLAAFDIACPTIEFSCTRAIARRTWPGRERYGLAPLGSWLGIAFRHHDALEDSRCCARIALAAAESVDVKDFLGLEKRLRLTRGRFSMGRITGPRQVGGGSHSIRRSDFGESSNRTNGHTSRVRMSRGQIDSNAVVEASSGSLPLAGKRIVCLGCLRGLNMAETQSLLETLGAQWHDKIQPTTDYVIACGGTLIDEATQVISRTVHMSPTIRLLSERQFLALLPGGKASIRW